MGMKPPLQKSWSTIANSVDTLTTTRFPLSAAATGQSGSVISIMWLSSMKANGDCLLYLMPNSFRCQSTVNPEI